VERVPVAPPRIVVVQDVLRRYRVPFFERLRSELGDRDITLELVHGEPLPDASWGDQAHLDWATLVPVRHRRVPGTRTELVWHGGWRYARGAALVVVEQKASSLVNHLGLVTQHLGGPPVALWGHGRIGGSGGSLESATKRWMSRRPHWWFAYTDEGADSVASLGFPRDRITVVRNSTDSRQLTKQVDAVTDQELRQVMDGLRLTGTNLGLFVGSLRGGRRIRFMIDAADAIRARVPDFELVFVGGGLRTSRVREACASRTWMRWVGPRFGAELAPLLRLAQLILVPGPVGLVTVDSFAAGVPLVTSATASHGPEIAYVSDDVNGVIVDDHGEPAVYAHAVADLLLDPGRHQRLVDGCVRARGQYGVEGMAARFAEGVERSLVR
jgi:glycosyltransferase involved in cell wall biosynthesis